MQYRKTNFYVRWVSYKTVLIYSNSWQVFFYDFLNISKIKNCIWDLDTFNYVVTSKYDSLFFQDMATLNHLSKTGRTPISSDQALAICCEIQAVNYVETSAKFPRDTHNISEAFELCALAAIRKSQKSSEKAKNSHGGKNSSNTNSILNNINMTNFKRSPSINSSLSLFEPMPNHMVNNQSDLASNQNCNNNLQLYKKSQVNGGYHHGQLRHSYRYQASLIAPPPLNR